MSAQQHVRMHSRSRRGSQQPQPQHSRYQWYYTDNNKETQGPIGILDLYQLYQTNIINKNTFVWNPKIVRIWAPLRQIPKLYQLLQKENLDQQTLQYYLENDAQDPSFGSVYSSNMTLIADDDNADHGDHENNSNNNNDNDNGGGGNDNDNDNNSNHPNLDYHVQSGPSYGHRANEQSILTATTTSHRSKSNNTTLNSDANTYGTQASHISYFIEDGDEYKEYERSQNSQVTLTNTTQQTQSVQQLSPQRQSEEKQMIIHNVNSNHNTEYSAYTNYTNYDETQPLPRQVTLSSTYATTQPLPNSFNSYKGNNIINSNNIDNIDNTTVDIDITPPQSVPQQQSTQQRQSVQQHQPVPQHVNNPHRDKPPPMAYNINANHNRQNSNHNRQDSSFNSIRTVKTRRQISGSSGGSMKSGIALHGVHHYDHRFPHHNHHNHNHSYRSTAKFKKSHQKSFVLNTSSNIKIVTEEENQALLRLHKRYEHAKKIIQSYESGLEMIDNEHSKCKAEIHSKFDELMSKLQDRKKVLLSTINDVRNSKKAKLNVQIKELKIYKQDILNAKKQYDNNMREVNNHNASRNDIERRKAKNLKLCKNVLSTKPNFSMNVIPFMDLVFDNEKDYQYIANIGFIDKTYKPSPPQLSLFHVDSDYATVLYCIHIICDYQI